MASNTVRYINPVHSLAATGDVRVGRIVDVKLGCPYVDFDNANAGSGVVARIAMTGQSNLQDAFANGHQVLLVLENGDATLPIIIGVVSDVLPKPANPVQGEVEDGFELNGKRISFEGREEVVLRCGKASITLRADGQVVVKGTRLMSRASETNKVRGATVLIN
jgi:Domain of unknown function (DUF6484)